MPITPSAEEALVARGVVVSPDFVANSATNAWWWWVFFGDIDGSAEQSFDKIRNRMCDTERPDVRLCRRARYQCSGRRVRAGFGQARPNCPVSSRPSDPPSYTRDLAQELLPWHPSPSPTTGTDLRVFSDPASVAVVGSTADPPSGATGSLRAR